MSKKSGFHCQIWPKSVTHIHGITPKQYLHLNFPLKEIEWSQDDLLRLVHSSETMPFSQQKNTHSQDVEPAIAIWKERNQSTKALIPCGN